MELLTPEYYHAFHCLADACPDSCCKEWEVDIDPHTACRYRELPGDLGDRLRAVLREEDGSTVMTITNGRCPMWRKDGLCEIQAELGHDALCQVCQQFPRLRHDYGDFVELGLELSCPEAARLIFAANGHEMIAETVPEGDAPEYDPEAMAVLRRSREELLSFLEQDTYSVQQSLAIMLLYSHAVQGELDGGEVTVLAPESHLMAARQYAQQGGNIEAVFDFFSKLEILTPRWRELLRTPHSCAWESSLRKLAQYGIQRYWLQAVSDYDLICRAKFIIIACIVVNAIGGDVARSAQLFSKEIENNTANVEAILDGAYTAPAFTDTQLLGLLLKS